MYRLLLVKSTVLYVDVLPTTHRYALLDPKLACRFIAVNDDGDLRTSDRRTARRLVGYRLSIGFSHEPREHGLLFEVGRRHLPLLVVAGHRHVVVVGCRCCGREGGSR